MSIFKSVLLAIVLIVTGCTQQEEEKEVKDYSVTFIPTLEKHLKAVSDRDLETLKSTLSPSGEMKLMLPATETTYTAEEFLNYHKEWFAAPDWTFETKILNTEIGKEIGTAEVEAVYKEPERNGKPYSNRLVVSYTLRQLDGVWYIIEDHASSIEKINE